MSNFSNIVLTGFMGTGKSSVGKEVASLLNFIFVDTDEIIESRTNNTINNIFTYYGEDFFRKMEKAIVKEYSQKENQVISTGGGVVLNPENIKNLKTKGLIILLKARPEIIYNNICKDDNRPLLSNEENQMKKIKELLNFREKYYKDNHYEIDVSVLTIKQIVEKIVKVYRSYL